MADTKAKQKASLKEKATKAYGSINKGLSKLDEWYWGKPKKKTSTKKKIPAKKPAETPRGTKIVIYVNGPAPAPARTQTKKTTRRK